MFTLQERNFLMLDKVNLKDSVKQDERTAEALL